MELRLDRTSENGYERGKAKRRQLILETATQIMSELGEGVLTIRGIAARAGLSPVTVYNLFGSKHFVLKAIFDEDLNNLKAYVERGASKDALVKLFDLIDLSTEYYQAREEFYKTLFAALMRNSGTELAIDNWSARSHDLRGILALAVEQGKLRKDTPIDVLATMFIRIGKAVTQEWVDSSYSAAQSRVELGVSYHTVLSSFTTKNASATMRAIRKRYGSGRSPAFGSIQKDEQEA